MRSEGLDGTISGVGGESDVEEVVLWVWGEELEGCSKCNAIFRIENLMCDLAFNQENFQLNFED